MKPRASRFRGKNGKPKNVGRRMTRPKPLRRMKKAGPIRSGRKVGKPRNQSWRKSSIGKKKRSGKSRSQNKNGNRVGNPTNKDRIRIPTFSGRKKKIKRLPRPLRFGK